MATAEERLAQALAGMQGIERRVKELAAEPTAGTLQFIWNRGEPTLNCLPSYCVEVIRPGHGNVTFTFPSDATEGYPTGVATVSTEAAIRMILRSLKISS